MSRQQHDDSVAPRGVSDDMRAMWPTLDQRFRYEFVRMCDEMSDGIAGQKDKICGRGKKDLAGYFGLERAERELHIAEAKGEKVGKLKALRERVASLRHARADDDAVLQRIDDLEEYHQMAKVNGTTVADYLREMTSIEQHIKDDPLGAFMRIGDRIGVDVLALLIQIARSPEPEVLH